MIKKIAPFIIGAVLVAGPAIASAQSVSVSGLQAELNALMQQLTQLQSQIGAAGNTTNTSSSNLTPAPSTNFTVTASTTNLAITNIQAPAELQIEQQGGTWTVFANDANSSDPLTYSATWGDASTSPTQSSSVFTHVYTQAGTYTPTFTVTDTATNDVSTAQVSVYVTDNETAPPAPSTCTDITQTLEIGSTDGQTGGQVSALQNFLIAQGDLAAGDNSGYFGTDTQQAVEQFQTANNISPVGFVGPQTRAAIASICNGSSSPSTTPSAFTATPASGFAPLSVTFTGMASGTQYTLNFGDGSEPVSAQENYECAQSDPNCTPPAFQVNDTHTYTQSGNYTATLEDGSGDSIATAAVTVASSTQPAGGLHPCFALNSNLSLGSTDTTTGGQVTDLQDFLQQAGFLNTNATGFFGQQTMQALESWQAQNGIVTSGTPSTTGFGFFGPRSRAIIARGCGPIGTPAPTPSGQFSATPLSGAAPLAVTFTVPATLATTTLDFGDDTSATTSPSSCLTSGGSASCSGTTVTHTYTSSGTYNAILTRDSEGPCSNYTYNPSNPFSVLQSYQQSSCYEPMQTLLLGKALITVSSANSSVPSATLTANGGSDITIAPGGSVNYVWNSTNAVSASATASVDSNDSCGNIAGTQYPWLAGVLSLDGTYSSSTTPCQTGHTYTITYTVTGTNGQTASSSVLVQISSGTE